MDRLGEVRTVDIGDKAKRHVALTVIAQRLIGHDRSEIGAADADVDDVANALAGMALPLAAPDAIAESRHLVQYGVDARNDVLAINLDHFALRSAQSDVQDRAFFRDVDLFAAKHGIDPLTQAGLLRQLQQQLQCLVGDAILGVIEVNSGGLSSKTLPTGR